MPWMPAPSKMPEPARLQRVLGRAARDDRAGQVARPVAVRHVPGRVHRLVLDVVEPGRGVEAHGAHGDRVLLLELQVLVEPELEVVAVGHQQDRVLRRQLAWVTFGFRIRTGAFTRPLDARHRQRLRDPLLEHRGPDPAGPSAPSPSRARGSPPRRRGAGRFSLLRTRLTRSRTASSSRSRAAGTWAFSSPPVMSRATRLKMLPSRLASSASSTMPPTSAFTPASSAESVKRGLAAEHRDRPLERLLELAPTTRRASAVVMPPTSTPGDRHALGDQVIARAVVRECSDRASDRGPGGGRPRG